MRMAMIIVASLYRNCQHLIRKKDEMSCPCPLFDPSRKAAKPTRPPTTTKLTTLSPTATTACVSPHFVFYSSKHDDFQLSWGATSLTIITFTIIALSITIKK